MNIKKLILIFFPALLVAGFALFVQIIRYEPLFPNEVEDPTAPAEETIIPIFPDDIVLGPKRAPVIVYVFEDFACPGCKIQSELLDEILSRYPEKIKIVVKGLPVARFPYSTETAQAYAYCSARQNKYPAFAEMAFVNGDNLSDQTLKVIAETIELEPGKLADCLASPAPNEAIERTKQLAELLNVQAVPAIFVNKAQVQPPATIEGWEKLLKLSSSN